MTTKFKICSRALIGLGEDTINSFTENNSRSKICGTVYPDYIQVLLSYYPWKFTFKKVQLARLVEAPVNKWKYKYQLPSDFKALRTVYDNGQVGAIPMRGGWEQFSEQIYTDQEKIYIDYQLQVAEEDFPVYFTQFAIAALSAEIALAITDDKGLYDRKEIIAWGSPSDNREGGEYGRAKRKDSVQNPTPSFVTDNLLAARIS